jgi:ATP-dependent DNA helicase RecG
MPMALDQLKGIGPKIQASLHQLSILTTQELLEQFPKRYEDYFVHEDTLKTIEVKVVSKPNTTFFKVPKTTFYVLFQGEKWQVIAYRKSYLAQELKLDTDYLIQGIRDPISKTIILSKIQPLKKKNQLEAMYQLGDIEDHYIRKAICHGFETHQFQFENDYEEKWLKEYRLISKAQAYEWIHCPKSYEEVYLALRRFKYDEAFELQMQLLKHHESINRPIKKYDVLKIKKWINTLPFELTTAQKGIVNDLFKKFKTTSPLYELIQGDVGSGKTVVSFLVALGAISSHEQVAFMAPTETLANEHYEAFQSLFKDIKVELITSSVSNLPKKREAIKKGQIQMIFGTHALAYDQLVFDHLGLVIIDEQHKFGVTTRHALLSKSKTKDLLYLSATPIPRSLVTLWLGHANVHTLNEKPKGRQPVKSLLMPPHIQTITHMIQQKLDQKEHVFIVVPAIHSKKVTYSVLTLEKLLKPLFGTQLFVLHGQLNAIEQKEVYQNFKQSKSGILLSTTIIEVGINVPSATMMFIFEPNYFGLSQLHQLRGRLGRGHLEGQFIMVSDELEHDRLQVILDEQDGFVISEKDAFMRGPGNVLGLEQSGEAPLKFLNLFEDQKVLQAALLHVKDVLKR